MLDATWKSKLGTVSLTSGNVPGSTTTVNEAVPREEGAGDTDGPDDGLSDRDGALVGVPSNGIKC